MEVIIVVLAGAMHTPRTTVRCEKLLEQPGQPGSEHKAPGSGRRGRGATACTTRTPEKTRQLFLDFLEIDVTANWAWQRVDTAKARATLDELISRCGDAVHRSRAIAPSALTQAHLVKRGELDQAVRFLKSLVEATDFAKSKPLVVTVPVNASIQRWKTQR